MRSHHPNLSKQTVMRRTAAQSCSRSYTTAALPVETSNAIKRASVPMPTVYRRRSRPRRLEIRSRTNLLKYRAGHRVARTVFAVNVRAHQCKRAQISDPLAGARGEPLMALGHSRFNYLSDPVSAPTVTACLHTSHQSSAGHSKNRITPMRD
jgi:hypothetical protein